MVKPAGSEPDPPSSPDPLLPVLREVENELHRRLRDACEAEERGLSTHSTAEIRRLEDSLLAAAMAAEQTITLRRHMRKRGDAQSLPDVAAADTLAAERPADESPPLPRAESSGVREFADREGHRWRAWPITPGLTTSRGRPTDLLGDFQQGWVCFERLDVPSRRRLPGRPAHWGELTDAELAELLARAIAAPERRAEGPAVPPSAPG